MLFRNRNPKDVSFVGVGGAVILFGSFVFSVGLVEWLYNYFTLEIFVYPLGKLLAGIVVLTLGYILLELELLRRNK